MSLRRFESPSRRDDSRFNLVLDEEARDYIREQAGVDTTHADPYVPCTAARCILTRGHDGRHYMVTETATGWHEERWS